MPDVNAYLKSIGANPTGTTATKKKKGPNVDGYLESIKAPTQAKVSVTTTPTPTVTTEPIKKESAFSRFFKSIGQNNLITKTGQAIEKATARPDYEAKPASTSAFKNTLRELPSSFIESIPLIGKSIKAIRDNPEEFSNITTKDLLKEIPGATGEVARRYATLAASYPLTFYGATSQYGTEKIGLGKAPGVGEDGRVNINLPILGQASNIQERIFTDKEGQPPASDLRTAFDVFRYTGEEFLNGLFTASLVSNVVNPRLVPVTKKGTIGVTEGTTKNMGPRSFRLYEPQTMRTPIDNKAFQKIVTDNKIAVNSKYNPNSPTFFEYTGTSGNTLKGRFVQVKDSYLKTFMGVFKGNPANVPTNQLVPVAETTKNMKDVVGFNANNPIDTPDEVINGHITKMEAFLKDPDIATQARAQMPDMLNGLKTDIVDGLKSIKAVDIANKVNQIPITSATTIQTFSNAVNAISATPVAGPIIPPVVTPKIDNYLKEIGAKPVETPKEVPVVPSTEVKPVEKLTLEPPKQKIPEAKIEEQKTISVEKPIEVKPTSGASIGEYKTGEPVNLKDIEAIKPIEMPEMVQLAKDISGLTPKVRTKIGRKDTVMGKMFTKDGSIQLRADLFTDPKQLQQAAATLAHEIGHLIDWLPDQTLKRGNLLGRLSTLKGFQKDFFAEAGTTRSDPAIRAELDKLSSTWRPYDKTKVPASFKAYRESAVELYADFISALFNNPKMVADMAPEAYNVFFKLLDKKPAVRDAYFELQALLSGDRSILTKARREGVNQMFKEGEYAAAELQNKLNAEKKAVKDSFLYKLKTDLVSKNYPVIERVKALEKQGKYINPDDDPRYYLEERNYVGGKIKAFTEGQIDPIYKALQKDGLSWDKEFAEALFYKRIIDGDRSKVANPRGITPATAQELDADLRTSLSPEQLKTLDKALDDFNKAVREITEDAYKNGLYTPELYKTLEANPTYATFQVLDYLEEGLTSKVYKSIGTLKDITNPATATVEKMLKTILAIERNKTTKAVIDTLKTDFADDIKPAEKKWNGRGWDFKDPKDNKTALVTFLREGKPDGFYVDPYIAKSINNESVGNNFALLEIVKKANRLWFRPAFIGYNLGFQSFNFLRDFQRFWKNTPGITMRQVAMRYKEALPAAKIRGFGTPLNEPTKAEAKAMQDLLDMEKAQILSISYNDLIMSEKVNMEYTQIEKIIAKYGNDPIIAVKKNPVLRYVDDMLRFIRNLGDTIETIPKVAGYYELKSRGPLTKADKSFIRTKIGSPDFLDRGLWTPVTNEVFLFSNAITQGWRSDLSMATDPKTRSGYWWKTAKLNFLPKIMMMLASAGVFGVTIKKMMDGMSEYNKTNYTVIPLGLDENGKTIAFRIPQDETGRFLSGLLWKSINGFSKDQSMWKDMANLIDFTGGQLPSQAPIISLGSTAVEFASGMNPYDAFRGRSILSDDVYEAGGSRAIKDYLKWVWQQAGGGIFFSFNTEPIETDKSTIEKIATNPIGKNIWGRFLVVSNFGTVEELREAKAVVGKEEAQRRLDEKDFSNKLIENLRGDKIEKGKILESVNQYVIDSYPVPEGATPEEAQYISADRAKAQKRLLNKLEMSAIRSLAIPEINELTYAETNAQKAAVLKKIEQTQSTAEFKKIVDKIIELGIITEGLVIEFNKLK